MWPQTYLSVAQVVYDIRVPRIDRALPVRVLFTEIAAGLVPGQRELRIVR